MKIMAYFLFPICMVYLTRSIGLSVLNRIFGSILIIEFFSPHNESYLNQVDFRLMG